MRRSRFSGRRAVEPPNHGIAHEGPRWPEADADADAACGASSIGGDELRSKCGLGLGCENLPDLMAVR